MHESGTFVRLTEAGAAYSCTPEIAEPAGRGTETGAT